MTYKLSFEDNPRHEDVQILGDGIMTNAKKMKGFNPLQFFAFFIRDEKNEIVGGCNGTNLYGCVYVDQLWIKEDLREQGWGKKLMAKAEEFAKQKNCTFMTVNTMDWEALDFYKKLGFEVEFERKGFEKNSVFYFLRKDL